MKERLLGTFPIRPSLLLGCWGRSQLDQLNGGLPETFRISTRIDSLVHLVVITRIVRLSTLIEQKPYGG